MIISCPDKFFVPVILLKDYREILDIEVTSGNLDRILISNDEEFNNVSRKLLEDKIIAHNVNALQNVSRKFLEDKVNDIKESEETIYEDISNIGDENLEYYIFRYATAFMNYKNELEAEGLLDINKEDDFKNLQLYVQDLRNLNNEFINLKKGITIPLTLRDQEAIEDHFIKRIEEIYSNQFANIKEEEKKEVINNNNIKGLLEETRQVIKRNINGINKEILNIENKTITKDETYFANLRKIYDEIEKDN